MTLFYVVASCLVYYGNCISSQRHFPFQLSLYLAYTKHESFNFPLIKRSVLCFVILLKVVPYECVYLQAPVSSFSDLPLTKK